MLVVTWNCNSLRVRLGLLLELLATHRPDVVCLQETRLAPEAFPHLALAMAGYCAVDHSAGSWNGVAILVPVDAEVGRATFGLADEARPEEARWVEVDVDGVRVVSAYVPHGRTPGHPRFAEKLAFLAAARRRVAELVAAGPTVLTGDLNVAPTDDDLWSPRRFTGATHVTPAERDGFAGLLRVGLVDAWEQAGQGPRYTWFSHARDALARDRGMRIDFVLASADCAVERCRVDRDARAAERPSDHAPLLAWLAPPRPAPRGGGA